RSSPCSRRCPRVADVATRPAPPTSRRRISFAYDRRTGAHDASIRLHEVGGGSRDGGERSRKSEKMVAGGSKWVTIPPLEQRRGEAWGMDRCSSARTRMP